MRKHMPTVGPEEEINEKTPARKKRRHRGITRTAKGCPHLGEGKRKTGPEKGSIDTGGPTGTRGGERETNSTGEKRKKPERGNKKKLGLPPSRPKEPGNVVQGGKRKGRKRRPGQQKKGGVLGVKRTGEKKKASGSHRKEGTPS